MNNKPLSEMADGDLISYFISLKNATPFDEDEYKEYLAIKSEALNRSKDLQKTLNYIDSVL